MLMTEHPLYLFGYVPCFRQPPLHVFYSTKPINTCDALSKCVAPSLFNFRKAMIMVTRLRRCVLMALLLGVCWQAKPLAAAQFYVKSANEIRDAMQFAQPGDTLVMATGVWTDQKISFQGNGTETQPIVLIAETPGRVLLNGTSTLRIGGSYLEVNGLRFVGGHSSSGAVIEFRSGSSAQHCRLTNTSIEEYNPADRSREYKWVSLYGTYNRVDHCYFAGKDHDGAMLVVWADAQPDYHRIDHNYFGYRPPLGKNGGETIRIGTSDWSMYDSFTIVESNYFERCNGEIEIISNKTGKNTFRYNTFYDCEGMLTLRHGNGSAVYGNFFFGNNNPLAGGVRIIGEDHKVFNNYFVDLAGTDWRSAVTFMNGVPNSPLNRYFQVINAEVAFNTFVHCKSSIIIGAGADNELTLPPKDCLIANNVVLTDTQIVTQVVEPVNMTWQGNIMQGSDLGIPQPPGIVLADPQLALAADSLWRPKAGSPVIGAAEGDFPEVVDDMDGQARGSSKDVGADQVSTEPIVRGPLGPGKAVGPDWLQQSTPLVLTVHIVGEGQVKLDPPGGLYERGTVVTLTAVPADSPWTFSGWSGDVTGTDTSVTLTMDGNKSVTATFTAPPQYKLSFWITGSGHVELQPPGGLYFEGTQVAITAVPDPGWRFSHWGGALSGSQNPDTLVMDRNKSVAVTFVEDTTAGGGVLEVRADEDFRNAVDYAFANGLDTLLLVTSGGVYTTTNANGIEITKPLTILAAPGLEQKPVLTNSDPNATVLEILRVYDHLTVDGVVFDGGHAQSHGMKYGIRIQPNSDRGLTPRAGLDLTVRHCDFINLYQDKDPNNDGHAIRLGKDVFAGTVRIEDCTFANIGYEAIRISDTEKYQTTKAVDSLIVRNCTFTNIDAECIRFYADADVSTPDAYVLIEHLTIEHSATRVAYIKNNKNSIFRDVIIANSRLSGHSRDDFLMDVQSEGSRVSHVDTFNVLPVPIKAAKGGEIDFATIYGFDPMFADPVNGDYTLLQGSPAYGKAHDGEALGDLRWAKYPTAIQAGQQSVLPQTLELEQNYPNPFNPSTTLVFRVPAASRIVLKIYNTEGAEVATLFDGYTAAGTHKVTWDASHLPSGLYLARLQAGSVVDTAKLLLVK
ncbi:MAG: T9SS C-terminal target domain-containing protein [Calditrichaeota bacterium]|nr:MAG: T9SS C-terminal target domain-containing protein [Calditrichota bacterium]